MTSAHNGSGASISHLFGRVPVMRFGLLAFGAGSVLAAVATSPAMLITARLIQGLGAAFLVPGSLALINTVFDKAHQSAAIGVITNAPAGCQPVPCDISALCRDRPGVQPVLASSPLGSNRFTRSTQTAKSRRSPAQPYPSTLRFAAAQYSPG